MKLAISGEVPAKGFGLDEFLQIVSDLGVSAIEIWPENIPFIDGKNGLYRSYRNRDINRALNLLDKWNVKVACASFGGAFDTVFTDKESFYTEELILAIKTASQLGAGFVNSYLYHLSMDDEPDYARLRRIYGPAVEEAEKLGIVLLLENEAHDSTKNPFVMRKIVEEIGSPYFRVNFDAVNYYQSSYEPFPFSFQVLKNSFSYIHIKDGCIYDETNITHNPKCVGGHMTGSNAGRNIYYPLMGRGVMNIPGEIRELEKMGYEGWCTIEPHVPIDLWGLYIAEEVKYLKSLGIR